MKPLLIVVVFLLSTAVFAQGNVAAAADTANADKMTTYSLKEVIIFDLDTKKTIKYPKLDYYLDNKTFYSTYGNNEGECVIEDIKFEYIKISCLGYSDGQLNKNHLTDTLFLRSSAIELKELVLYNKKFDYDNLGYFNSKKDILISNEKGGEIAVFIENKVGADIPIQSFLFRAVKKKKYKIAVRFHLYKKSKDKLEPGEDITTKNIIFYLEGKQNGVIEFDLLDYNFVLPPEGIFIGLEWLDVIDKVTNEAETYALWSDLNIEYNSELDSVITFTRWRDASRSHWHDTSIFKPYLKNPSKYNFPNASFGIKVIRQ